MNATEPAKAMPTTPSTIAHCELCGEPAVLWTVIALDRTIRTCHACGHLPLLTILWRIK